MTFAPERELRGLTQFLESYEKIWQSASQNNNDEISRYVVYQLNWLLAELVQEPGNQLFVEQFLRLRGSISHTAIKEAQRSGNIDPSIYSATIKHKAGNISQKIIEEFKKEVLKSFYEGAALRDVFVNYLKVYEDKTKEKITGKKERLGINIVNDKASFFDEWRVRYVGWGENYGRDLSSGENSYLLDDVAKDCKVISKKEFDITLSKFINPDDIIIFATNVAFWRFFEDSKNFKPKWHRDIKQLDVKSFGGWYDFNGKSIPVFKTYHRKIDKQVLVLNKTKLGQLIQLSPLNDGEDEKSIEDVFYMDIQAFSENQALMEEFIKKPPEWLKKIGDEQKQREHLRERVRIQIFERFEYNKPADFEGYKLTLKDD